MQRTLVFSIDEYYHIYNRGVDKRVVFNDSTDYVRFVTLLSYCNDIKTINIRDLKRKYKDSEMPFVLPNKGDPLVEIGAWCLMPNHFHLLLKERCEGGISKFMLKVTTAYTMYFNKRYGRSGALFQGVFKAEHLDNDNYLKYTFSYIHLNPVKLIQKDWKNNGILDIDNTFKFLKGYAYSSYLDYCESSKREWLTLLNKEAFPKYFIDDHVFEREILDWLRYQPSKNVLPEVNPRAEPE